MKTTKCIKVAVLASLLLASSSQALPLISTEFGGMLGTSFDRAKDLNVDGDTNLTYGAYARVWLKPGSVRIAPFIKWENLTGFSQNTVNDALINLMLDNGNRSNNLQYGAVVGFEFFYFTPYAGISYSQFTDAAISNTWALNYGLKFDVPLFPITVGVDASWQKPKVKDLLVDMYRVNLTVGLQF